MGAQALKNAYRRTIDQYRVTVTIRRVERVQEEGEWRTTPVTIGPFRGGLQRRSEGQEQVVVATGGVVTRSREWILMVEAKDENPVAELEAYAERSSEITDTLFIDGHGGFRIADARVDAFKQEVCGYTLILVQEG